jgi:hypothetical protein
MTEDNAPLLAVDANSQDTLLDMIGVMRNNLKGHLEKAGDALSKVLRESVKEERPIVFNDHQAIKYGVLGGEVHSRYSVEEILEEADMVAFKCNECGAVHAPTSVDMRGDDCGTCGQGEYDQIKKVYFGGEINHG